jgi:hypothetical protein
MNEPRPEMLQLVPHTLQLPSELARLRLKPRLEGTFLFGGFVREGESALGEAPATRQNSSRANRSAPRISRRIRKAGVGKGGGRG